jgi:hypothetical protein
MPVTIEEMESTNRRLFVAIGVVILVGCLCLCLIGFGVGGYFWNLSSGETVTNLPVPTLMQQKSANPTQTTPKNPNSTSPPTEHSLQSGNTTATPGMTGPSPGSNLPADVSNQMDKIQEQVIELRGLASTGPVRRSLLTQEELRQHVVNDFLKDYTQAESQKDALVLAALGLLTPDFDLYDFYVELYSEQIAGFYDDETNEMYVIQGEGFLGPERLTYSHEYTHALQDQHYGTQDGLGCNDDVWEQDSEGCAALQALIEGDASFLEITWLINDATRQDRREIEQFITNLESPVFNSAPSFMQEDFLFPYSFGQLFVEHLYKQGGWDSVDQAYHNQPVSTEQILHPDRYPADRPVPVDLPDMIPALGGGWREIDRGAMGEWNTFLILAEGLDPTSRLETQEAQTASEGWGGDAYVVYYNDQKRATVLVLRTIWDSAHEADEFGQAFEKYASARFNIPASPQSGLKIWDSPDSSNLFRKIGEQTTWIMAPDSSTAQAIYDTLVTP